MNTAPIRLFEPDFPIAVLWHFCRDGGNTFTPERYRLELNSAHTFTGRQAPSDPHTVSGVFFFENLSLFIIRLPATVEYS